MKKLALLALIAGTISFAACNNSPSKDKNADGEVSAGEQLDHTLDSIDDHADHAHAALDKEIEEAEARVKKAQADLDEAVRNGDKERSEEHTSELQSREKLVCRLLL